MRKGESLSEDLVNFKPVTEGPRTIIDQALEQ